MMDYSMSSQCKISQRFQLSSKRICVSVSTIPCQKEEFTVGREKRSYQASTGFTRHVPVRMIEDGEKKAREKNHVATYTYMVWDF